MSRAEAEAVLGKPRVAEAGFSRYKLDTLARPGATPGPRYNPAVYVTLVFEADTVIKMNISQGNELVADQP
jgi:hypothetical protein